MQDNQGNYEMKITTPNGKEFYYYINHTDALQTLLGLYTLDREVSQAHQKEFQEECRNILKLEMVWEIRHNPILLEHTEESFLEDDPIITIKTINIQHN